MYWLFRIINYILARKCFLLSTKYTEYTKFIKLVISIFFVFKAYI